MNYLRTPHSADIQTQKDIRNLVDSFYGHARRDPLLGPVFEEAIHNWQEHLPTMYQFWERLLLGASDYNGNPFQKHLHLALDKYHFTRWLELFFQTIDENFSGAKAEEAKKLARSIADSFQLRMGINPENHIHEINKYSHN